MNSAKSLAQVTDSDIVTAIRGQHFMVTNGPILLFDALDYNARKFNVRPGDILDLHTTEVALIRTTVYAAPWITLNSVRTRENGDVGVVVNVGQSTKLLRYPTGGEFSGTNVFARYLKTDSVLDAACLSTIRSLEPVVPNPLEDFGGEVMPYAWSGPIFADRDGDGKIVIPAKEP